MTPEPDGERGSHHDPRSPDLTAEACAHRVRKLPIPVCVVFAAMAGVIETLEGAVRHEPGDAILTGVQGERWPVPRKVFDKTYTPATPTRPGEDGTYVKMPRDALAIQLRDALSVPVGEHGDLLRGRPGDWLLQYDDGRYGVVCNAIFQATYEQR